MLHKNEIISCPLCRSDKISLPFIQYESNINGNETDKSYVCDMCETEFCIKPKKKKTKCHACIIPCTDKNCRW